MSAKQPRGSRLRLWTGRVLTGWVGLFLLFDGAVKLPGLEMATEATVRLGIPATQIFAIGVIELLCVAFYLVPRTAPLGALLLTAYLGGRQRFRSASKIRGSCSRLPLVCWPGPDCCCAIRGSSPRCCARKFRIQNREFRRFAICGLWLLNSEFFILNFRSSPPVPPAQLRGRRGQRVARARPPWGRTSARG
jgi:hypothetical protein